MTDTPQAGGQGYTMRSTPAAPSQHETHGGHGGHRWMMILCSIPMLVIASVLLAVGVIGVWFLVFAVVCTAMMAVMMRGMSHGGTGGI